MLVYYRITKKDVDGFDDLDVDEDDSLASARKTCRKLSVTYPGTVFLVRRIKTDERIMSCFKDGEKVNRDTVTTSSEFVHPYYWKKKGE